MLEMNPLSFSCSVVPHEIQYKTIYKTVEIEKKTKVLAKFK